MALNTNETVKIGLVQMSGSPDPAENLQNAANGIREAADQGAKNVGFAPQDRQEKDRDQDPQLNGDRASHYPWLSSFDSASNMARSRSSGRVSRPNRNGTVK